MTMATTPCTSCGAASTTADYCDSCGAALGGAAAPKTEAVTTTAPPGAVAPGITCPGCGAARTPDDVFCEVCGLDFATGKMPAAPAAPVPASVPGPSGPPSGWTAVIVADRAYFDSNQAETPGAIRFPEAMALREVPLTGDEVVIGRRSEQKGFFPGIDLSTPVDPAVSHRHAVLRRQVDGTWGLVDEMSTNGTWLNDGDSPVAHGVVTALRDGDRIHLGSFTLITIRKDVTTP